MDSKQKSRVAFSRSLIVSKFEAEVEVQVPTKTILRLSDDPACGAEDETELVEMAAMLALTERYVEELMYSGELIEAIEDAHGGQELELVIANLEGLQMFTSAENLPSSRRDEERPDAHVTYLTRVNLESLIESRNWHDGMLWQIYNFEVAEIALLRDLITGHVMRIPEGLFVEAIRRRCEHVDGSKKPERFDRFRTDLQRLLGEARSELEAMEREAA